MSGYQNNYGGGQGNFQPKPRPILPPMHALNHVAEAVISNKRELKNFAQAGKEASTATINVAGVALPLPLAALMVSHQYGVPSDHPDMHPIRKLNSQYPDNAYVVMYAGFVKPKWTQDPSFWHLPCFNRYVINESGVIKNATNGEVVTTSAFTDFVTELVPDGPVNMLRKTNALLIQYLALGRFPDGFTDYGYGSFSHKMMVVDGLVKWAPLPKVKLRSTLSGAVLECINIQEFIATFLKDFGDKKMAREQIREFEKGEPIRVGEYVVTHEGTKTETTATPPMQESVVPAPVTTPPMAFDTDLAF